MSIRTRAGRGLGWWSATAVVATVAGCDGCGSGTTAAGPDAGASATPTASADAPLSSPFKWTTEPRPEDIPPGPLLGVEAGQTFAFRKVWIEPGRGRWRIRMFEREGRDETGSPGRAVIMELPVKEKPQKGSVFLRAQSTGDGGVYHLSDPQNPGKLISYTASHAYVVEVTEWSVKDYDPAGPDKQDGGTATIRVAVVYPAANGYGDAFAAGTFEGATVHYPTRPYFVDAPPKAD